MKTIIAVVAVFVALLAVIGAEAVFHDPITLGIMLGVLALIAVLIVYSPVIYRFLASHNKPLQMQKEDEN